MATMARMTLLLILSAIALQGCAGDSTGPGTRREIAVFGHLYVGEAVDTVNAIHVIEVMPIDDRYVRDEAAVSGARVTLAADGGEPRTLEPAGPGAYAAPDLTVAPSTGYTLRVELPDGRVLTARTVTPPRIDISGGPPAPPLEVRHEALQDSFPIFVLCEDPQQVLLTDVYCLERWQDARWINPIGPDDGPTDYEEYGRDDGQPRHIFAYFRVDDVVSDERGALIDFYGAMMAFYGSYQVHVSAIDENTYAYLYKDHPEESGGIVGGIGLFGSACRREWRVRVTP